MTPKTRILIIIPALNEERIITSLIQELKNQCPDYTFLVVDDGSSDNTAKAASAAGALVIKLPYNLGIGGAVQTGYRFALQEDFDIAVQMDGDAQHDPKYLRELLAPVLEGQLDLCIGSRFLNENTGFQSTFTRRIGISFFSVLLRTVTGLPLTDPTSGFRAVNKKLIREFARSYPVDFPEPEVIQVARRLGARVGEVPVQMRKRIGGISSIRYLKTIYYMFKVTLAILIDTLRRQNRRLHAG